MHGPHIVLDEATVQGFKTRLRGPLLCPGDADYEEARQVWNAMIDRRPALIVRCAGVADVLQCVQFARTHHLLLSVRGCSMRLAECRASGPAGGRHIPKTGKHRSHLRLHGGPSAGRLTEVRRHFDPHAYRDDPSKGWLLFALCVVILAVFAVQCTPMLGSATTCTGIHILSDELRPAEVEAYCRYAMQQRQKVEAFWGATWSEPLRIHVSSVYRISRALVPGHHGNRGFLEMPLRGVRENTGALLHEIVHIYAPNPNRFLAEGLAVYLHTKLASNPAFPNFGKDLRRLAARGLADVESLDALHSVRTPRPLSTIMETKTAYILAGSFVGFVIERYGLAPFRSLYETGNYEQVYGKPFKTLEAEWRESLREY